MATSKIYDLVTDQIMDALRQGDIPWRKPWQIRIARNMVSRKEYRGINVFLLNGSAWWASYRQIKQLGGYVRKGEKSTLCVFWKLQQFTETDESGERSTKTVPLLRYYRVFSIDQCELPDDVRAKYIDPDQQFNPIQEAESVVSNMPNRPEIEHRGNRAFYRPSADLVVMPPRDQFHAETGYYDTLFHELGHSTGHSSRLNRKTLIDLAAFGDHNYSKEELVAEMTSAFLCGVTGIVRDTIANSAAYIQSWLRALDDDRRLVVHAAAQAQKAADYILDKAVAV